MARRRANTYQLLPPIRPVIRFSDAQLAHRDHIHRALVEGDLRLRQSVCFCGEARARRVVSFDAWGLNLPTVWCLQCHTLRSEVVLDEASLVKFYTDGYYRAHMFTATSDQSGVGKDVSEYFGAEYKKGHWIYDWIKRVYPEVDRVRQVAEVGCGAGGILAAFRERGFQTVGCDWNAEYIAYGRTRIGQDLRVGGVDVLEGEQVDLVILSDFVEHLDQPVNFLRSLIPVLANGGLIYVNVPGVFGISWTRFGCNFRQFTKIEHLWCHTLESLTLLFDQVGCERVAGDQYVRGLFRRQTSSSRYRLSWFYGLKLRLFLAALPARKGVHACISAVGRPIVRPIRAMLNGRVRA